jgi:hypothetical protein
MRPYDQAEHDRLRKDLAEHRRDLDAHRERVRAFQQKMG